MNSAKAFRSFETIIQAARDAGPVAVAVAGASDRKVLTALSHAMQSGLVHRAVLTGKLSEMSKALRQIGIDSELEAKKIQLVGAANPADASARAVAAAASGEASILIKGFVDTATFMRAVLDREKGLRGDRLLSQVGIYEIQGFDRLILVADVGIVVAPDLAQKKQILENAADVARALQIKEPGVALLSFAEFVDPAIPATVDAAALAKMGDRGQIKGVIIDGPLALDNAVSQEAAAHKGIVSPVAGRADILIMPDLHSGNIFAKSLLYIAHARSAGVVVGARVPIVLTSRSDPAESKLNSIAVARLMSSENQFVS